MLGYRAQAHPMGVSPGNVWDPRGQEALPKALEITALPAKSSMMGRAEAAGSLPKGLGVGFPQTQAS